MVRSKPMRRRLYLVLDDWSWGYTIREIDLLLSPDENYTSRNIITGGFLGKQRLPPPIMRVEAARGSPTRVVPSGSSKLMFLQLQPPIDGDPSATKPTPLSMNNFVPIADVRTRSISFGPRPTDDPVDPVIYVPVAVAGGGDDDCGRIFALDSRGAFSVFCPPAPPLDDPRQDESWSWRALPDPPFERRHVVSYAACPDGGGLIVSTKTNGDGDSEACFAFAMAGEAEGDSEWSRQHHMSMPFAGRGHFDPALDAFVGLAGAPGSAGHLCLVYADGSRKLSKEKLFGEEDDSAVERQRWPNTLVERLVGSTLVYMGGRSNFCLVQCLCHCHGEPNNGSSSIVGENGSKLDADQDVSEEEDIVDDKMMDDDDDQDVSRHRR